jgi:hypothetical protein
VLLIPLSPPAGRAQGQGAPEGIRTPNLLIRSQMLYPLSYGRPLPGGNAASPYRSAEGPTKSAVTLREQGNTAPGFRALPRGVV